LLCHGTVCVVGKMRDLILQLSKSSIYSTKPSFAQNDKVRELLTGPVNKNPFRYWLKHNPEYKVEFKNKFESSLINALINGFGIESGKVYGYLQIDK
ncbi:hypothetical protein L1Q98_24040, partial [Klebsiella pneumoniae]